MSFTRRTFVRLLSAVMGSLGLPPAATWAQHQSGDKDAGAGALKPDTTVWMEQPATAWWDALPVGNGSIGAMIFGGVRSERIALNADTLWSGMPRDWNNPGAKAHLPVVRKLVLVDQNYQAADEECRNMEGPWNQNYEPLGDLLLTMTHEGEPTGYRRWLDLDSAVAHVEYECDGVQFHRQVFASFPDKVIVMRVTANRPHALNGSLKMASLLQSEASAQGTTLLLSGKAPKQSLPQYVSTEPAVVYSDVEGEGMHFASSAYAKSEGGELLAQPDGSLLVKGATSLVLTIGCATGYRGFASMPSLPLSQVVEQARAASSRAASLPFQTLLEAHTTDHQNLFRRMSLDLPSSPDAALATDKRVEAFAQTPDPSLLVLVFNLGRYLLIASSRPGSQPANLQGIWNSEVRPPWSSNWTTNINTEMNYWLAETCNLSECHLPLIEMVRDLSVNGAKTAAVNYGAPGWCAHHNVDLWRQSAPVGDAQPWAQPTWANWCMSGVWLSAHLWEHYQFTNDLQYLREVAYPVMRGAAEFCSGWLIDDGHGGLTTCPSVSPENAFIAPNGKPAEVSAGTTMDIALVREIFANCTEASTLLNVDESFRARMAEQTHLLAPYKIGRYGQLQEWSIDFVEEYPGMRHLSHLYPVYPGRQITPRSTPELAAAARKSLERRLAFAFKDKSGFTGWGRAWAIALWARLQDGDMAWDSLKTLVSHSLNGNLFDDVNDIHAVPAVSVSHGVPGFVFQIDANFGTPAAIAEMLLQSHDGVVEFLPALPKDWEHGQVKGLRARGGLEVAIEWKTGAASKATVQTFADRTYPFRAPKGQRLLALDRLSGGSRKSLAMPDGDRTTFSLKGRPGEVYFLTFGTA